TGPEIAVTRADNSNLVDGAASISLGSVNLGSAAAPVTLTLRNVGTAPLTGIAVSSAGSHLADFTITTPAATTLAPGVSTTFSIGFRPTGGGIRTAVIRIASNDADENPFDINLSGNGIAIPVIALEDGTGTPLSPGSAVLSFPDILVGEATGMKTIVVKNTGTAGLTGLQASLSGTQGGNFILSTPPTTTLAPGASTTLQVSFSPQEGGGKTASLLISSSATPAAPLVLGLTGNAITAAEIAVYQDGDSLASGAGSSAFGNVNQGTAATSKVYTIRNLGSAPLTGLKLRTSNPEFSVGSPGMDTLAPGGSTTFKVGFKPSKAGARSGIISLASNDADESPFLIHVTGSATAA
ncbi:MAG: choice-of-anchor D domain-containing protein, partial [Verrucomicrobiaceae bacterium]